MLTATVLPTALRLRSEMAALRERTLESPEHFQMNTVLSTFPTVGLTAWMPPCLMSARQRNPQQLSRSVILRYCRSLSCVIQYVRTTHYLNHNHHIGQFVPYVQNSYSLASLCSPWKYYASYHLSGAVIPYIILENIDSTQTGGEKSIRFTLCSDFQFAEKRQKQMPKHPSASRHFLVTQNAKVHKSAKEEL